MITLEKSIQAFNRENNLDWRYFQDNGFSTFALLLRLATDRGYVWKIAHGELNSENDNLLKTVAGVGGSATAIAGIVGANIIPVVGQVLSIILTVSSVFDFSAFGTISDSTHRVKKLLENNKHWQTEYIKPSNFGTQGYVIPTGFLAFINTLLLEFPRQLPKCVSPSTSCKTEHKQFQTKIELHLEGIHNCLIIYSTYFNPQNFQEFISVHSDDSLGNTSGGSGSGGSGHSLDNKTVVLFFAIIIIFLIITFVKK